MSNHVHLVLVPSRAESLGRALKHAHGRYASYWNAIHHSSGHVWQGRYYSCPLDEPHLWEALRYTEFNPVRAGLVAESESWMWSVPPPIALLIPLRSGFLDAFRATRPAQIQPFHLATSLPAPNDKAHADAADQLLKASGDRNHPLCFVPFPAAPSLLVSARSELR